MRTHALHLVILALGFLGTIPATAGEVIDSVVVTVNGAPVLQSDIEDALRFEAFLQQRSVESFTASERRSALDRVIDHELLRQQMQADYSPTAAEIAARLAQVRAQFKGLTSDAEWHEFLARYGLDPKLLRDRVAAQLQILQFIELRLRATVRVDRDAVETYYREKLLPQLQQMGAPVEPLSTVEGKITELLAQRRMDELLDTWLANLRSQSDIHITHSSELSGRTESAVPVERSSDSQGR